MRLSRKSDYATRAVRYISNLPKGKLGSINRISEAEQIPREFLAKILKDLTRAGILVSYQGVTGGYRLAKQMNEVTVADIITAVDEPIDATQCGGKENCHDDRKCLTHDLWVRLNDQIFDFLRSVTLGELVEEHRAKQAKVVELHDQRPGKRSQSEPVAA